MFERLTDRTGNGQIYLVEGLEEDMYGYYTGKGLKQIEKVIDRLAAYEDSGLSPGDCTAYAKGEAEKRIVVFENYEHLREIRELMQAKADGRLVVLPCKVGSDLWSIERARTKCTAYGEEYSEYSCQGCEEPCDSVITQKIRRVKEASHMTIAHFMQSGCFGKTVFLTREEAEKALEVGK